MAERFNIIWHDGIYYVSIPNYKGGEVVDADSFDAVESTVDLLEKNARVQAKLLADTARQRDVLVEALMMARRRIDYLGAACTDSRHFEANDKTYLPKIDAVLDAVGGAPK